MPFFLVDCFLTSRSSGVIKSASTYIKSRVMTVNKVNMQASPALFKAAFKGILSPQTRTTPLKCITNGTESVQEDVYSKETENTQKIVPLKFEEDLFSNVKESYFDSHCHLDFLLNKADFQGSFSDYKMQHPDEFPPNFDGCIAVFCNPYSFRKFFSWEKHLEDSKVWASFGCHPKNAAFYDDSIEQDLLRALGHPKVRALGEIGLDYSDRSYCPRDKQQQVFRRQLRIANEKHLPLVLHCREAYEDCYDILKEELPNNYPIHMHCFSDSWCIAEKFLGDFPNLHIGLTNLVTFPSAVEVQEVAKKVPLQRLLLETDAPYFVPTSLSKTAKFAHPGMAIYVAEKIASLRGISVKEVVFHTRQNANWVYNV